MIHIVIFVGTALCYAYTAAHAVGESDYSELLYILLSGLLLILIASHRCRPSASAVETSRAIRVGGVRSDCPGCHRPTALTHIVDAFDLNGHTPLATHIHCTACDYCHFSNHSEQEPS